MNNRNLELGRVGLLSLDPKDQERVLKDAAEEFAERYAADLKELLRNGGLIFGRMEPSERLAAYMGQTLDEDVPALAAPDYWELRQAGLMGPLVVEQMRAEYMAVMEQQLALTLEAEQQGMSVPPPEIAAPPMFWAVMIELDPIGGTAFRHFQQDFSRLSKSAAKREGIE